jgi:hemoglobin/transferrin/lactoferrin receptor protein
MHFRKLALLSLSLVLTLVVTGIPCQAEEGNTDQTPTAQLSDTVVTASGRESSAFDTSVPMNVITSEDIEERGAITMADVFKSEPGINAVTTGPNSVRPMIRGLYDERVLVLVNGVRLSEQRPGGNHILSLDPSQIERVEVVRGPASVLYGSDAIAGVINIITKQAPRETGEETRMGGSVSLTGASNPEGFKTSANVSMGQGKFNALVGGFYQDTDNVENAEYELNHSSYRGGMAWASANYLGDRWQADFYYYFMNADMGIPASAVFYTDEFADEKEHFFSGKLSYKADAAWADRMEFIVGAQRHNRNRERLRTSTNPEVILGDLAVNIQVDIDTLSLKPIFFKNIGDRHKLAYGLDTFYEDATSGRTLQDTGSSWVNPLFNNVPVIPDSQRKGVGVFAQDEINLGPRWVLTAGLRYDWISSSSDGHPRHMVSSSTSQDDSAVSGSLGLLFKVCDALNLYANVGRAFRAPTLLERYFYGPHDSSKNDVGDPDLSAETSWNFDLGLKLRTNRVTGMFSLFYNIVDDYIAKMDTGEEYTWMNLDRAVLYGGEASLNLDIYQGLSAFTSASYVIGENEEADDDLPCIPPLNGKTGLRYDRTLSYGRGWAELSYLYAAKQDRVAENEEETAGWSRFDLRLGYLPTQNTKIVFAVENLGDHFYHDHLSRAWQDLALSAQNGRTFKLMLEWSF